MENSTTSQDIGYVSYQINSPNGYNLKLSFKLDEIKNVDFDVVMAQINVLENQLKQHGFTSAKSFQPRQEKPKEVVPGRTCPKCGKELLYKYKKDGTKFIKCSGQRWNPTTKQAYGCDFVEWSNKATESAIIGSSSPASGAQLANEGQIKMIENLQFEGRVDMAIDLKTLTFEEAKKILIAAKNIQ